MRVLITGFGHFPGAPFNPTAALVKALGRRRRPALAAVERSIHVFATSYEAVDRDLPTLLAWRPDIVLMFGLAGRTRHLRIETRARNAVSVLFPDASGHRPQQGVIMRGGPAALPGRAPFWRLLGAVRASALPAQLSRDAGRYLCNYLYWQALQQARGSTPGIAFVHIPPIGQKSPRPLRRCRQYPPSLRRVAAAAEALLIALIAARRR